MSQSDRFAPLRHLGRAFRHRNYRLYFAGQLVSLTGTWMQSVAQSWLVYRMTGSASLLGLIAFAGQAPLLLLSPVAGVLADRHSRRHILLCTQAAAMLLAAMLAALTLSGAITVWEVGVLAMLLGMVNAFDVPARQAMAVEMVGREDLPNAIALNSSMFNGARLVGPAVAGLLVAAVGEGWVFAINAASFVAVIGVLLAMRLPDRPTVAQDGSMLKLAAEGVSYVFRTMPIRTLIMMVGLVSFAGMPYSALMPIFVDHVLGRGAASLGLLLGANGLGAMAGALTLAMRKGLRGIGQRILVAGLLFGTALVGFSLSRSYPLSLALMAVTGFSMMTLIASCNTLVQSMVPEHYRGRTMAVYAMVFMGFGPFGALLAGAVAQRVGAPAVVAAGGISCIAGALAFRHVLPLLREKARLMVEARRQENILEVKG